MPEHQRKEAPQGYYNLGLAHGVPGIVYLLSGAAAAGVAAETATGLLEGCVGWLLSRRIPNSPGASFTYWMPAGANGESAPSRSAWCYGDPGVFAALYLAGKRRGNAAWEREAVQLALACAARPKDQAGVMDPGLCHGGAGLAHIYNRMYQATGESALAEAARFWFEKTLDMRKPGEGLAGFLAWHPGPNGEPGWAPERGLLTGAAGVGLALLAGIDSTEPEWDRFLLIS